MQTPIKERQLLQQKKTKKLEFTIGIKRKKLTHQICCFQGETNLGSQMTNDVAFLKKKTEIKLSPLCWWVDRWTD